MNYKPVRLIDTTSADAWYDSICSTCIHGQSICFCDCPDVDYGVTGYVQWCGYYEVKRYDELR